MDPNKKAALTQLKNDFMATLQKVPKAHEFVLSGEIPLTDKKAAVTQLQAIEGAIFSASVAIDFALTPEKYRPEVLADKAKRQIFNEVVNQGNNIVNNFLPDGYRLDVDYPIERFEQRQYPSASVGYQEQSPLGLGGQFDARVGYDPETRETRASARYSMKFSKGGKVYGNKK